MSDKIIEVLAVGRRHPHAHAIPAQEGFLMHASPDGVFVNGLFPGITKREDEALRTAEIKVGLVKHKDVIFVLANIPGMSDGWVDMPFSMAIEREASRGLPERDPGTALLMTFVLIDMPGKIVASLRMGTLSPGFWEVFEGMIAEQLKPGHLIDKTAYMRQVQEAYSQWSPNDLAKQAVIIDTLGRPFQKDPNTGGAA